MPRFLLLLESGGPADPAVFVDSSHVWAVGDTFLARAGKRVRILVIDDRVEGDLAVGFSAVWTVEELPG